MRFKNPFMNDYAAKMIEVHTMPPDIIADMCTEPIFWLNSKEFKFKVDPNIQSVEARPIEGEPTKIQLVAKVLAHGIGDSPE